MRNFPPELRMVLEGARETRVTLGESGDDVRRYDGPVCGNVFLKIGHRMREAELRRECEVLRWLDGRLFAPLVRMYCETEGGSFLLMNAVPGMAASQVLEPQGSEEQLRTISRFLGIIHQVPIDSCPFNQSLEFTVALARDRAKRNLVDLSDLDEERRGWTKELLLGALEDALPSSEDMVFTHGDFCLPNVLISDGEASGVVDWGRGGIGDRYRDIALLLRSYRANTEMDGQEIFCEAYGMTELDPQRLYFYRLLDEFF